MDLRHEWKHRINVEDLILLRQRLRLLAKPVVHSDGTGDFCRDGAAVLAGNLAAGGSPVSPGHCSPGPVNGKTAPVCHQCRP